MTQTVVNCSERILINNFCDKYGVKHYRSYWSGETIERYPEVVIHYGIDDKILKIKKENKNHLTVFNVILGYEPRDISFGVSMSRFADTITLDVYTVSVCLASGLSYLYELDEVILNNESYKAMEKLRSKP